ncbi:unnamed protein product, partial [Closterium sp. NIES-53]
LCNARLGELMQISLLKYEIEWLEALEVWRSMRRRRPVKGLKLAVAERERKGKQKEGEAVAAGTAGENEDEGEEEEEDDEVEQDLGDDQEVVEEEDNPFLSDDEDVVEVYFIDKPVDPPGSILYMGPPMLPLSSLPIARLGHALSFCLPRARGARPRAAVFCPFAALGAARHPDLPVVRPMARDGALSIARPGAHGGFAAPGGSCAALPSPVVAPSGARAAPPSVARRGALGGPRATLSCRPSRRLWGPARGPLLTPAVAPTGARMPPIPVARCGAIGGQRAPPPAPDACCGALGGPRCPFCSPRCPFLQPALPLLQPACRLVPSSSSSSASHCCSYR